MKILLWLCFLFTSFKIFSQDKIFLLNGECVQGRVIEISRSEIKFVTDGEKKSLQQKTVLLIQFKNGEVEILNSPNKDAIFTEDKNKIENISRNQETFQRNFFSINTLALCNADIAGFYEKILKNKILGIGCMAAYNFNSGSSISNVFISILGNSKKNYDLGFSANVYPAGFQKKTTLKIGILVKYTDFSFTSQINTPNAIIYTPAKGSQLATLLCFGTHTKLIKNYFIKTFMGLGGFTLHGIYKDQFNFQYNAPGNGNSGPPVNFSFLPKMYIALNVGVSF